MTRSFRLVFLWLFLAIIATPGLALLAGVDRSSISESEMRELASVPTWSWHAKEMAAWPSGFLAYFDDQFGFRARLLRWQSTLLWRVLHTSSSDTVIAGRQRWLFYADDGGIQDYLQNEPFSREDLEAWRQTAETTRAWLLARGIPYLFVIAPDKQMIYPEYMPGSLHRMRRDYRADQFIAYMRAVRSPVEILDLRPAVMAAKDSDLLYHRYDTHWNDRGGLAGYQPIATALHRMFPAIRILSRSEFDAVPGVASGDKTTMLGLVDPGKVAMPGLVLRGGWHYKVVEPASPDPYGEEGRLATEISGSPLPRAVVFRDSFAGRLIPYLSEDFSRAVYLWQNNFDPDVILQEHPNVVIQEFVARHFVTYLP